METSVYYGFTAMFLALILWEVYISSRALLNIYHSRDVLANISIAVGSLLLNLAVRGAVLYLFYMAYAPNDLVEGLPVYQYWIILFILADFIAYWFHYLGHKSRFFWASHVIHHSSNHYNFTTAIRVPLTNFFYRFLFYVPLCLAGFKPLDVLFMESCIYIYNFYLHTQLIGKLGLLEFILNTPSHHRVHHGKNDEYIDRNFGGVLIIWDRIFGTFQPETVPVKFGIQKQFDSVNPWKIISHEWIDLYNDIQKTHGVLAKLRLIFGSPAPQVLKCRWALVTGGSSGIGLEIVRELARRGINMVVVALPGPGLNSVESEIRLNYPVDLIVIPIDLTDPGAAEYVWGVCSDREICLDILVNNAGIGNHEFFDLTDLTQMQSMMKLNNEGMVKLIYLFLPQLKEHGEAFILNVGSMAALSPIPCKAVYSATKSFVYSFSRSLRGELKEFGISVSCLLPGGTDTRNSHRLESLTIRPQIFIQPAASVARAGIRNMFKKRFRIIPGYHNHIIYYLWRILPPVIFSWLLRRIFLRKRISPGVINAAVSTKQPRSLFS